MRKLFKVAIIACLALFLFATAAVATISGWLVWRYEYAMGLPDQAKLAAISTAVPICASGERSFASLSEIPPLVRAAFLAADEPDFYSRPRINPFTEIFGTFFDQKPIASPIANAVAQCLTHLSAKCCKGQGEHHIANFIMLRRVESSLSKDAIFEIYLNEAGFGRRAFGVGAAAKAYFGKSLPDLTVNEVAYLAALRKNPYALRDNGRGEQLRNWVVGRMQAAGTVTAAQAGEAMQGLLPIREVSSP